jgi:hypothetical protein
MPHGLLTAAQSSTSASTNWHDVAQTWQAIITAAAIIVGGVFTYVKFFKDRVYRPRVNITLKGGHIDVGGTRFLMCRITMVNCGTSKLGIVHDQDETRLYVYRGTANEPNHAMLWGDPIGDGIVGFARHSWFESGETLVEELAIKLPDDEPNAVYRLRFLLAMHNQPKWSRKFWSAWEWMGNRWIDGKMDLTRDEKEQRKSEKHKNNEHSAIIDVNGVTTVWPTDIWQEKKDDAGAAHD